MTLVIALVIIILLATVVGGLIMEKTDNDRLEGAARGFTVGLVVFGAIYVLSQFVGMMVNTHTTQEHNYIKIVSLQDGSQVQGTIHSGLFVTQVNIDEMEWFSYYRDNGDGSYSFDKQLASLSSIIPDATPSTAHISSTSSFTHCEKKWWSTWCGTDSGIYDHGDFHVPAGSIENNFVLDAK